MTAEPDDKGIVKAEGGFSRRIGGGHVFLNKPYKPTSVSIGFCVMFKSESMEGFSNGKYINFKS